MAALLRVVVGRFMSPQFSGSATQRNALPPARGVGVRRDAADLVVHVQHVESPRACCDGKTFRSELAARSQRTAVSAAITRPCVGSRRPGARRRADERHSRTALPYGAAARSSFHADVGDRERVAGQRTFSSAAVKPPSPSVVPRRAPGSVVDSRTSLPVMRVALDLLRRDRPALDAFSADPQRRVRGSAQRDEDRQRRDHLRIGPREPLADLRVGEALAP